MDRNQSNDQPLVPEGKQVPAYSKYSFLQESGEPYTVKDLSEEPTSRSPLANQGSEEV